MIGRGGWAALLGLTTLLGLSGAALAADPAVKMGDWSLTVEELDKELLIPFFDLEMKRHQLRVMKAEEKAVTRALELEAKERKTTTEALLQEAAAKADKVTDEQVKAFLDANRSRIPPTEDIAALIPKLKANMEEQSGRKAQGLYVDSLLKKYKPEVLLPPPTPPRLDVKGPYVNARGPENAPVTLVEYSDFQCPFCKRGAMVLKELEKEFPSQLRVVYRHLPLPSHTQATKAAEASQCAGVQGKFWEYHDAIFENQEKLDAALLKDLAGRVKLDVSAFNKCLDEGKTAAAVKVDMETARTLGVNSTPTFFLNGIMIQGALPTADFKKMIQAELENSKKAPKTAAK
ncbi:MAG: DsbA family protein [Magnetococcales bacterium]|nr:DsbA family protein [Magnetococcales bacterium]